MFILVRNGFSVKEFPISLPARTYGSSKMTLRETMRSGSQLLSLWIRSLTQPARFRILPAVGNIDRSLIDPQNWNAYWDNKDRPTALVYDLIARLYRVSVIKRQLEHSILKNFPTGAHLLHAGCGSGQVDMALHGRMNITAIDISPSALKLYERNNPGAFRVRHADILDLPFPSESFDGAYNLGVVEHFSREGIQSILAELHRVLKPGGKLVIFWPHERATSVAVLKAAHWLLNHAFHKPIELHPPEISLMRSREWVEPLIREAGFRLSDYSFGARDLFVQAVVVAEKSDRAA
jgi:ubiquinone/menaquinone biosynthesis C-methylase UbiE